MSRGSLARAVAVLALLWGCERSEHASIPSVAAPDALTPGGREEIAVPPPAEPAEPEPALPPRQIELSPSPAKPTRGGRQPQPRKSQDIAAATAEPAASAIVHLPLDALLRAPDLPAPAAPPPTVEFEVPEAPAKPVEPKPPGTLDRLGHSIRLEGRKNTIGVNGPRQGTFTETEAGLRIPVDRSISLEGGVRVDSRSEPGAKEADRRSTPRVGVEVRF
jgi:hypothetical protein